MGATHRDDHDLLKAAPISGTLWPRKGGSAVSELIETEEETRIMRVPWDHAASVMGDAMQPQGLVPERWRVDRFPSEEEQAELRRAELSVV